MSTPPDSSPIHRAQRWVLAVMALFPERRDPDGGFFAIVTRPQGSAHALSALSADGLLDADDVRRELVLRMALARASEPVYNLARASLIAARAHTAYLIPLEEAWATALECARLLQQHCRGWFSMAEACLTGLTTHQGEAVGRVAREAFYALHARPDSPWNLVSWKTELPRVLPPPEVVTERVHVADQHELAAALANAHAGQTIVLAPNRYVGPFHIATGGLTLSGGPDVFIVPAAEGAPEALLIVSAPTALERIAFKAQPGAVAVAANTPFLAIDECHLEGGLAFSGSFLQVRETTIRGAEVGLALASGEVALRDVRFVECGVAIEQGPGVRSLRLEGGEALGCGTTLAANAGRAGREGMEAPVLRLRRFVSNSGILDFRDDARVVLSECRLDGGVRVGGGELTAERCQLSATSQVEFAIATFRECHFLGASGDNLVLGESQLTTLSGGQLGSAEGDSVANLRVLGGSVRLDGVSLGPSTGNNLVIVPTGTVRVELSDVALSSAAADALVIAGDAKVSTRSLRIRGAGRSGLIAENAQLALVGLDVADVGGAALEASGSHIEVVGFGLRGVKRGLVLGGSTFIARDLVATGVEGPLVELRGGRTAIAASDILLGGDVADGAVLSVARAHVSGLRLRSAEVELERCRLGARSVEASASRLSLRRCEIEPDAVAHDESSTVATETTPTLATGISPLLVSFRPEPFSAWGVTGDIGRLLAVARVLAKRLGYLERLGLRETPQGLRVDGPLPVVARFAPQLSALIASPSALGVALAETLEPS